MTFDNKAPTCRRGQNLVCAACECSLEALVRGTHGQRCAWKHTVAESIQEKAPGGAEDGVGNRCCAVRYIDERDDWITSYVRTRLRTMAGDTFSISRHTADVAARALKDRFLSDTDAVLKRILDLAALGYLRDGTSTVTVEDVTAALRSVVQPHR